MFKPKLEIAYVTSYLTEHRWHRGVDRFAFRFRRSCFCLLLALLIACLVVVVASRLLFPSKRLPTSSDSTNSSQRPQSEPRQLKSHNIPGDRATPPLLRVSRRPPLRLDVALLFLLFCIFKGGVARRLFRFSFNRPRSSSWCVWIYMYKFSRGVR